MNMQRPSRRTAFTLVEMLVVIVIIGILAGLLIPAVGAARKRVIDGRIAIEISNLDKAVEAYKQERGDYPPNSGDLNRLQKHMLRGWPKIDNSELASVSNLLNQYLDAAEVIPFWLGGFSSNPRFPFTGPGGPLIFYNGNFYANPERLQGLYEFDKGRLTLSAPAVLDNGPPMVMGQLSYDADGQNDSFPVYLPYGLKMPLVYFDARTYGDVFYPAVPSDSTGVAKPYLSDRPLPSSPLNYEWVNPQTFQIISAGRDGNYGSYACIADVRYLPIYPIGTNYDPTTPPSPSVAGFPGVGGDHDNIANFSEGGKLQDRIP